MPVGQVIASGAGTVQFTTGPQRGMNLQIQNNSAASVRAGDSPNVSLTTPAAVNGGHAGLGILLLPGGADGGSFATSGAVNLNQWYAAFSAAGVIDYQYTTEE
jgi:hypothetical protein